MIRQSDCGADNPKQVKRFKCANENKNIAIIGFKNLMKAHKHKQTLDLDLLWIHLVSCILLEKCHCNIFAMAVSVYPLVTGQPTESHMMSYDIKKKKCMCSRSFSYLVTCTASSLLSTPSSLTQVEAATSLPPATSSY